MRRVRSIIALLLLALWLPATLHCDLEAAGIDDLLGLHHHEISSQPHCPDGPCHSIEGLSYKLDSIVLKVAQPNLPISSVEWISAVVDFSFAPVTPLFHSTAPPGLAATWQFSHRTAALNQAPPSLG